ncbi:Tyrosine-protein kinase transmembrane receptor Ror2 [Halotydeus destructor]|nr:Tyrosine-protein kinase transmembrane receptor Ror2 [Halotydeus destructor]
MNCFYFFTLWALISLSHQESLTPSQDEESASQSTVTSSPDGQDDTERAARAALDLQATEGKLKHLPNSYCAPYSGSVCKKYINPASFVYYNLTTDEQGTPIQLNELITQSLWSELISPLLEPCRTAAETLVCYYAFPQCKWTAGQPSFKPLCREDCIAVRDLFCYNEWALIEDNKQKGVPFKSRGHFRLPDCESLPSHGNVSEPECSRTSLTAIKHDEVTYTCIKGKGRFYQGTKNVTKDGIACQKWESQAPHSHNRPPLVFPEVWNSENYCRNAGGEEPLPWCYTMDPHKRWQHCDISSCDNSSSGVPGVANDDLMEIFLPPSEPLLNATLILILGSTAVTTLALLVLIIGLCFRIRKYNNDTTGSASANTRYSAAPHGANDAQIDLDKLPSNQSYHCTGMKLNPILEGLEYPRNDIIYIRDIGQGAFGRVFQAKAPGLVKGEDFTMVAVKMLKDEATDDLQSNFEREACLMAEFNHANIVKLIAVCAIGKPMCLLFEYMGRGDLNNFLRSCSPSNYIVRGPNSDHYNEVRLSHLDLLNISRQIAAGMVYLSERKFVHRDLASRNCLVNDQMVVKIADFGLSQKMYTSNYYKGGEHDAIPIRWMPLESILYNKFTVESDIWAYGIILWEIFSFGMQPYYGMVHEEVIKYIKDGNTLNCPDNTPQAMYQLMKNCWHRKASNRPSFKAIHRALCSHYDELAKNQMRGSSHHVHL